MSKKTKAAGKEKRLKEKRARKAAEQSRYQKYAETEQNAKSKRNRAKKAKKQIGVISHPNGRCGNPACEKCFGTIFSRLFFENGKPYGMPQKMYLRWKDEQTKNSREAKDITA